MVFCCSEDGKHSNETRSSDSKIGSGADWNHYRIVNIPSTYFDCHFHAFKNVGHNVFFDIIFSRFERLNDAIVVRFARIAITLSNKCIALFSRFTVKFFAFELKLFFIRCEARSIHVRKKVGHCLGACESIVFTSTCN